MKLHKLAIKKVKIKINNNNNNKIKWIIKAKKAY